MSSPASAPAGSNNSKLANFLTGKKKNEPAPAPRVVPVEPQPTPDNGNYSVTNGKWTLGGLNKQDVYKLMVTDGY